MGLYAIYCPGYWGCRDTVTDLKTLTVWGEQGHLTSQNHLWVQGRIMVLSEQVTVELDLALGCRGCFSEEEGGAGIKQDKWGGGGILGRREQHLRSFRGEKRQDNQTQQKIGLFTCEVKTHDP